MSVDNTHFVTPLPVRHMITDENPEYVELGSVPMRRMDAEYVLLAVAERTLAAHSVGVSYGLNDFIREALIEAAHR